MPGLSSGAILIGSALLVGVLAWLAGASSGDRTVEAGLWFEEVAFESPTLGAPLTAQELDAIAATAMAELRAAFAGLRVTVTDRRDVPYRLRVVQEVRDLRSRRAWSVAGGSRAIAGLGGEGVLSLSFLASGAVSCAPPAADRAAIVQAIGRGVGRTAAHELAHQVMPRVSIHDSTDVRSYEYASAARCEHYFGEMHWSLAWPLLEARLGRRPAR